MKRKAFIDLGTNTFHLFIVELHNDHFKKIHYENDPPCLGQGGIHKNILLEDAMDRGLTTLKHFKNVLNQYEVTEIEAFGTSALRNAQNSNIFLKRVLEETGIAIQVISGEEEAQLIYEGVTCGVTLTEENHLIMDIGGGSVEFIICNQNGMLWKQSFEMGGQRLMQFFHQEDPISQESISQIHSYITESSTDLHKAIHKYHPKILIGASGAFDTLCEIYFEQQNVSKNYKDLSSYELPIKDFWNITGEIISKNEEDRRNIKGMKIMRVKMIVVSSTLIQHVIKEYQLEKLICTNYALKEGAASRNITRGN